MKVEVLGVQDNGEVLQLHLAPSDELVRLSTRSHGGKLLPIPITDLRITLSASCGAGVSLPTPPDSVELSVIAELVARIDKASVFVRANDSSQQELADYVRQVEQAAGMRRLLDVRRIFHVSLSNLTGAPRGSIAKVWEHSPVSFHVSEHRECQRRGHGTNFSSDPGRSQRAVAALQS
jgi:hypothetical protein